MEVITFQCSKCRHTLRIGADKAGRKARCTKCGSELVIPPANPPPKPAAAADPDDEYSGGGVYGFKEEAPKPPPTTPARSPGRTPPARDREDDEVDDDEHEEETKRGGPPVPKPAESENKGPKRKIARQRKLLDPDKWRKVQTGFRIVAAGMCIWIASWLLQKIPPVIGFASFVQGGTASEYAGLSGNNAESLLGLVSGAGARDVGLLLARIGQILVVVQGLALLLGYGFCLPMPPRFGSRGLASALLCIGSLNLLLQLVLRLLPLTGAIGFTPAAVVAPEVVLHAANIDRSKPLLVAGADAPFAEVLLAIFVASLFFFEPVMFVMFMRAVALTMKDENLESKTRSLMALGLGQIFAQTAFQLIALAGTSIVLQWALRVVWLIATSFFLWQLIWFALVSFRMPELIEKELGEETTSTRRPFAEDEEDEEEEEEEED